jgi:4-amino-4-deoxy-L-arabinose transferase-like glycosyltransferase
MHDASEGAGPARPKDAERPYHVSLVLPVRNGQTTIGPIIRQMAAVLADLAADFEILIVDYGSSDDTAKGVRDLAAQDAHIRFLEHPLSPGPGAALRTGLKAARFDLVVCGDDSGQLDPATLAYLLPLTRHYDLVCGYRVDRQEALPHRLLSWGYNTLTGLLLGTQARDLECKLKVCRREVLPELLPEVDGRFAQAEMVARAKMAGLSVVEVGVKRAAGVGRLTPAGRLSWRETPRTLAALLRFWWSQQVFPAAEPKAALSFRTGAALLLLALLAGLLLLPKLGYALIEPDEGRYAEIGREMLTSGDWIVPTLNRRPYLDKPPLVYWMLVGSYEVFGATDWAARLVPALAALLTVLLTFFFGRRAVGERAALLSALVLALTPGFMQCGRFLFLDNVLALWVAAALFAGQAALRGGRLSRPWWLVSAGCCGLGILTKGPVAVVLVVPPLFAFAWLGRWEQPGVDAPRSPGLRAWIGYGALALGLALPWYVAVVWREPSFAYSFFVEHHLARFFGQDYHAQPGWFYVPVVFIGFLPWSLLLVPCIRFLLNRSPSLRVLRPRGLGLYLLWGTWVFSFFSLSRGKLPPYLLPAAPALALLIGCFLDRTLFESAQQVFFQRARGLVPLLGARLLAGVGVGLCVATWPLHLLGPAQALALAGLAALVFVLLLVAGSRMSARGAWLCCGVLAAVLMASVSFGLLPAWSGRRSPLASPQAAALLAQDRNLCVACFDCDLGSVPFYAHSAAAVPCFNEGTPPEELRAFLLAHPRTLFIIRYHEDRAVFQRFVPADMHAVTVLDPGEAAAVLVAPVQAVARNSGR